MNGCQLKKKGLQGDEKRGERVQKYTKTRIAKKNAPFFSLSKNRHGKKAPKMGGQKREKIERGVVIEKKRECEGERKILGIDFKGPGSVRERTEKQKAGETRKLTRRPTSGRLQAACRSRFGRVAAAGGANQDGKQKQASGGDAEKESKGCPGRESGRGARTTKTRARRAKGCIEIGKGRASRAKNHGATRNQNTRKRVETGPKRLANGKNVETRERQGQAGRRRRRRWGRRP